MLQTRLSSEGEYSMQLRSPKIYTYAVGIALGIAQVPNGTDLHIGAYILPSEAKRRCEAQ